VLLPVFDAARTLGECLQSVATQTEPAFECVLVDDGSGDDSLAVARAFAASDARFRVLSRPHRGLVDALNTGLAACRAPVVVRMDADDRMHPERLAAELAALSASPELAAVGCQVRLFPRGPLSDGLRAYERWLNSMDSPEAVRREAFVECPVAHPTLAVRREVLLAFRYRDEGWPEDYDLVLRLLAAGRRIGVVARALHDWRDGPGRLSRRSPSYSLEAFTRCRAHFLAAALLEAHGHYTLWGYGGTGRALCRALGELGKRPRRIVELHPGRLGQRIQGAEVVPPEALDRARDRPLLVSVAGAKARAEIRQRLGQLGFIEVEDFVCCA